MEGAAQLCVLASGSGGNCAVVIARTGEKRSVTLIDLGLSARATAKHLAELGLSLGDVDNILITHLDTDHLKSGWTTKVPPRAAVYMHARHADGSGCGGLNPRQVRVFEAGFTTDAGVPVKAVINRHDRLGSVGFRFDLGTGALGYATDLGLVTPALLELMRGVDVLAIESNYCPVMQEESDRPTYLKRRIMGGHGHLSNQQCVEAIGRIGPRHVVLLHLSRQCNDPAVVAELHKGSAYGMTIASQYEPTGWVGIGGGARVVTIRQESALFAAD